MVGVSSRLTMSGRQRNSWEDLRLSGARTTQLSGCSFSSIYDYLAPEDGIVLKNANDEIICVDITESK